MQTTTIRLMMTKKPQETDVKYKDKTTNEDKFRVREYLQAYLLGHGAAPMTLIDININKFTSAGQTRNVKITDLYEKFIDNKAELTSGKKVLLAHVEMIPQKSNFNNEGNVVNAFQPYLTGFDIAEPSEADKLEIAQITRVTGTDAVA